ncbi:MAG: DNA repair protein RecO [Scytolyngbya sp. HA4215-MV1]|jgi:DNA repair protein RecO (recombination protein O)|nr:DNA repair protein RecO [Scytolyngbya sp. HA4215-MV1]
MSRTYKATGINLKSMPIGEFDRLVTILTREHGLVRAVAAGSRKHQSKLGGRSGLFVVNELLIAKGRSLDKITHAETLKSYPGLGHDLRKLTVSQYLAELVLYQAFSDQAQEELFCLFNAHLAQLEKLPSEQVLTFLNAAIFQFLALAGVAPQVHACCVTQQPLLPNFENPDWRIGFSAAAGGVVVLSELERITNEENGLRRNQQKTVRVPALRSQNSGTLKEGMIVETAPVNQPSYSTPRQSVRSTTLLKAVEFQLLQHLAQGGLSQPETALALAKYALPEASPDQIGLSIEQILRQYTEYHFERPIRSASLIDACFASLPTDPSNP